jgi:lysophospholipase L1-like esterase
VDASAYAENLRGLIHASRAHGTEPLLLAFPMVEPPAAHLEALRALEAPLLAPTLPREAFFAKDPVHLNATGHARLAEALAAPVREALSRAASR